MTKIVICKKRNKIHNSRVEVCFFVLSLEIEDRNEVEVGNWAKHKMTHFYYFVLFILIIIKK
jgi:hypothetical protein